MSEASWQAQTNEQQEWDADHDLHIAWCSVAMGLANDYAEAYCNHQCDDTKDNLAELGRTRRELKVHLFNQPASMTPTYLSFQQLKITAQNVLKAWDTRAGIDEATTAIENLRDALAASADLTANKERL